MTQSKQQKRNRRQKQQGGAGDASYAANVYPSAQEAQYGAQGNVIQMNEAYAISQHNGPVQAGGKLPELSPALVTGGAILPLSPAPAQAGGKLDLTTIAVPAALLVANQLYSRRRIGKRSSSRRSRRNRRLSRRRR